MAAVERALGVTMTEFADEFEEFRARARSGGGTMLGLLRPQSYEYDDRRCNELTPGDGGRIRSRSLVPMGSPTEQDQAMLQAIYNRVVSGDSNDNDDDDDDEDDIGAMMSLKRSSSKSSRKPCRVTCEEDNAGETHEVAVRRDRGLSLPALVCDSADLLKPPDLMAPGGARPSCLAYRRRSFSTTPKGIHNDGDLLCSASGSVASDGADEEGRSRASSSNSQDSAGFADTPVYRVLIQGACGVGKTALIQQFTTSEYVGAQNTSFDDVIDASIPVLLDGEESVLDFIDIAYNEDPQMWASYDIDAFVVIYSLTDRRSFHRAMQLLRHIKKIGRYTAATILVASKSDLVRTRTVGDREGRLAAEEYDCKYTEVSAALNHRVDELLVGILKQIRLTKEKQRRQRNKTTTDVTASCLSRAGQNILGRILKPLRRESRSCENLLAL